MRFIKSYALRQQLHVPDQKMVTIPIGINNHLIQSSAPKSSEIDLIFFGRLLTHKNVDRLLHVVARVSRVRPDVRCLIIGNGPERRKLEELSSRLGLANNVGFKDFLPTQEEVYSYLRRSKIFVSLSTREGFGLAPLEAMAAGLPVVIVDHPDNAVTEFVTDRIEGFVCPLDEAVVAERIVGLLTRPGDLEAMSRAAMAKAKTYDIETTAVAVLHCFQALVPVS
ncbi:MAG: glycosyltransferase family 4 protein [Candidatus Kerfeldbacteria bacterium]|nr:glycosyltransferase family 4 protein [Candidatus Kerfeldbacteria bacterium]